MRRKHRPGKLKTQEAARKKGMENRGKVVPFKSVTEFGKQLWKGQDREVFDETARKPCVRESKLRFPSADV